MRFLVIDGSDGPGPDSSAMAYGPDAPYPPYNVFDPEYQCVICCVRYLWVARLVKWICGGGWSLP